MQVRKQQLELDMEQQTDSKLGKEYVKSVYFSFFSITDQGIDLDYCDIERFALEMNRDHSVVFKIASKYCISDSFVDYEGYSISSKGYPQ